MTTRLLGEDPALSAFGVLLAVHAHPDDETLSTGGLLATWAAAGRPAVVVTCTRGERGEVIALPGTTSEGLAGLEGDGPALGAYRESELAGALAELAGGDVGAIEQTFLDAVPFSDAQVAGATHRSDPSGGVRYEDSGMAWAAPGVAGPAPDSPPTAFARVPLDEPAGRLATLIRARRPAVVATYEPGGGYGHPDHVRTHEVTVRALELAADPDWRPDGGSVPAPDGEPAAGVGRRDEPWAGAELWQAVARAAEVREARARSRTFPRRARSPRRPASHSPIPGRSCRRSRRRSAPRLHLRRPPGREGSCRVRSSDWWRRPGDCRGYRAHATQVQHATALPRPEGLVAGWYALSNNVLAPILTTETYLVSPPR